MRNSLERIELGHVGVLVIAYRRANSVRKILEICYDFGIRDFYVAVDAPKTEVKESIVDSTNVKAVISEFLGKPGVRVGTRYAMTNVGCAVSVITACEWAFSEMKNLIILEDDCIPSPLFIEYCLRNFASLQSSSRELLICGTQFAPPEVSMGLSRLSRYALTWGWATTREKWFEIRKLFFESPIRAWFKDLISFTPQQAFWNAGRRRALLGYTDVWDTILVRHLFLNGYFALLPPINLVTNIGNDSYATHTKEDLTWTNRKAGLALPFETDEPRTSGLVDRWISKNCYRISLRHLVTTKLTLFADIFRGNQKKFKLPLPERLRNFGIDA